MATHWAANGKKKVEKYTPNIEKILADHCPLNFFL